MILQLSVFGRLVEASLADDRVDRDRRFAGRAVANDQLALAATDRDHRVDRHDAGLDRLANAPSLDDAGRDFFDRIKSVCLDRPFVIDRLTESVYDAPEKRFADRDLQKPAGRLHFISFRNLRRIAEQNDADLRFLEIEREAEVATRKLDHLVQHHLAQALDPGDAIAGFADHADVAFGGRGFESRDLCFDFFQNTAHDNSLG